MNFTIEFFIASLFLPITNLTVKFFPIIIEIESMKATQLEKTKNIAATPPKGTESIYSVFLYNTISHQPLYLKEILT